MADELNGASIGSAAPVSGGAASAPAPASVAGPGGIPSQDTAAPNTDQELVPRTYVQQLQSKLDQQIAARDKQIREFQQAQQAQQTEMQEQQWAETQFNTLYDQYYDTYKRQNLSEDQARKGAEFYANEKVNSLLKERTLEQRLQSYEQREQEAAQYEQQYSEATSFAENIKGRFGLTDEQLIAATQGLSARNNPTFYRQAYDRVLDYMAGMQQQQSQAVQMRGQVPFPAANRSVADGDLTKPAGIRPGTPQYGEWLDKVRQQQTGKSGGSRRRR